MRSSKAFPFQHVAGGLVACFCLLARERGKKKTNPERACVLGYFDIWVAKAI